MDKKTNDLIKFPSGGMSHEDTGGPLKQNIAVPVPGVGGSNDGDLPSVPGVSGFGEGPDVIKNKGGYCSPGYEGMPGAE